jgi:hypothetical protein
MRRHAFNWAYIVLPVSGWVVCWLTIWFPIRLWNVIGQLVPRVDRYTELGEKRQEVDAEYSRLLERDKHPFNFLYNCKSGIMAFKLARGAETNRGSLSATLGQFQGDIVSS